MINTQTCTVSYSGTGSTGPFALGFDVYEATDLLVTITDVSTQDVATLVLGVDFTVAGLPATGHGTGNITLTNPLAVGYTLTITRNMPYLQDENFQPGTLASEMLNDGLDRATMLIQQAVLAANSKTSGGGGGGATGINAPVAFPANTATPSLAAMASVYETANTAATTITGFSNLIAGYFFKIIIGDDYTTVDFNTWYPSLGAGSIVGHQGQTVSFNQGDILDCVSDGTWVYAIDSEPMLAPVMNKPSRFSAQLFNDSPTEIEVFWNSILIPSISGLWAADAYYNPIEMSATADATTLGPGGLDIGSLAPNTWYYIWIISAGAGAKALLSTRSFWSFVNQTYVADYTYARLVGAVLTDANSHFIPFQQQLDKVFFTPPLVMTLAAEAEYTEITTGPFPQNAVTGLFEDSFTAASGAGSQSYSSDGVNDYHVCQAYQTYCPGQGQFELPFTATLDNQPAFYYKNSGVSGTPSVIVRGFTLNI